MKIVNILLFLLFHTVLQAENLDAVLPLQKQEPIPDFPSFTTKYDGHTLECFPKRVIEKKTRKHLIEYLCVKKHIQAVDRTEREVDSQEQRGRDETKRLRQDVEDKVKTGGVIKVEIPQEDAKHPWIASYVAKRKLENWYLGQYIRWLFPAKFYISLRPQIAGGTHTGVKTELRDAGSRAGFFYYYRFDSGFDLTFQYEGTIDWDKNGKFINLSDQSNTARRLSYLSLDYEGYSLLVGKYWSAYYDIAGLTDYFMAFGAQGSGAFNNAGDGSASGTGRTDSMLQLHARLGDFENTLQYQNAHSGQKGMDRDYRYAAAASTFYKGWVEAYGIAAGVSFAYAKFDEVSPYMRSLGIDGDDQSYIVGGKYEKEKFFVSGVFSYTKNHMNDERGIYFDALGAEFYTHYDYSETIRFAGGINLLVPHDKRYHGKFTVKNLILSGQYTFGKKTFDDLVYIEVTVPAGKLSNGTTMGTSVAIGLRYLIDL